MQEDPHALPGVVVSLFTFALTSFALVMTFAALISFAGAPHPLGRVWNLYLGLRVSWFLVLFTGTGWLVGWFATRWWFARLSPGDEACVAATGALLITVLGFSGALAWLWARLPEDLVPGQVAWALTGLAARLVIHRLVPGARREAS